MAESQDLDVISVSVPGSDRSVSDDSPAKPLIPTAAPAGAGEQPTPTPLEPPSATVFPQPSEPVPADLPPAPQGEVSMAARVNPETGLLEILQGAVDGEPPYQLAGTTVTFDSLDDFELTIFKLNAKLIDGQDVRAILPAELLDSVLVLPDGVPLSDFLAAGTLSDVAGEGPGDGPANGVADGTSQTIIIGEEVAESANSAAENLLRDQPIATDLPQRIIDRGADGAAPGEEGTVSEDAGRAAVPPGGIADESSQTIATGEPISDAANAPADNLLRDQPVPSDLPQRIIDRRSDGATPVGASNGIEDDDRAAAPGEVISDVSSAPADNLFRDRPGDDSPQPIDADGVEDAFDGNQGGPLSETPDDPDTQGGVGDAARTPPEPGGEPHAEVPPSFEEAPPPASQTPPGPPLAADLAPSPGGPEFSDDLEQTDAPLRQDDAVRTADAELAADPGVGPATVPEPVSELEVPSAPRLPDAPRMALAPSDSQSLDPFDASPVVLPTAYRPGVDFVAMATSNQHVEFTPAAVTSPVQSPEPVAVLPDAAPPPDGGPVGSPNVLERVLDYVRETVLGADEPGAEPAESALSDDCDDDTFNI